MEAQTASWYLHSQFSTSPNRLPTPTFLKPILSLPSTPKYKLPVLSNLRNRSRFELSSTTTPTVSTDQASTYTPEVDIQDGEDGEKFDWFSHWYPIGVECELDKRVPHARRVMGLEVVVWWDRNEKKWQVFDDSCPHRLAPLSEGRIDQWGRLQCVYHGWCFNGSGDCKLIPQAPLNGPPVHTSRKACAAVYPSIVQNKIVWFWPKTDPQYHDIAEKEKPPHVPEMDDPSYSSEILTRDFHYGYEVLLENFMDPAHLPYAHYGIVKKLAQTRKPRVDREGGMPLEINLKKLDKTGFLAKKDNEFNKFVAPCLFYYFPSTESADGPSSSGSINKKASEKRLLLVFFCIPVSPGKSRLLISFPRNFLLWLDQIIPRWIIHIRSNLILDSDLYLLHMEERKLIALGGSNWHKACYVPTKSDTSVIAFRNWMRKYSGGEIDWGDKFNAESLSTPPREQLMDRYWSHVVKCSSCSKAVSGLKTLEVALPIVSLALIGIVAMKQSIMSMAMKTSLVSLAVLLFATSKWLSHFIYKTFYFHDYFHALR